MKTATVAELKKELKHADREELLELCLRMAKFKKENKELLTYLLFESSDEESFIASVKEECSTHFSQINTSGIYYIKKSIRKIQREVKKYIRYSKKKETEVELLIHFCREMAEMPRVLQRSTQMRNLYLRQIAAIDKVIAGLHEDLQYDYLSEMRDLPYRDEL